MSASSPSSLSHLLQGNSRGVKPSFQAGTEGRSPNVAGDVFSCNQVQVASPATMPPVTSASLNTASALGPPSGGALLQRNIPAPTPTDQSHLMTSSLYQCADCKKRYSRPEHLARHIQTHTLGKRFFCQVCGKAFARADLLKRHAANHDNDRDGTKKRRRMDASPGSGRVSHACRLCAAARVKCEEIKPCQRCQRKGLTCEYTAAEAGSAAAMHLLHLSADAHSSAHTSSASSQSSQFSPTIAQDHGHVPLDAGLSAIHETRNMIPSTGIKPEQGQLRTPDAMVDQSRSIFSSLLLRIIISAPTSPYTNEPDSLVVKQNVTQSTRFGALSLFSYPKLYVQFDGIAKALSGCVGFASIKRLQIDYLTYYRSIHIRKRLYSE